MPGIADTFDTTFKILKFFGRFPFGTHQMSGTQYQTYKAKSEDQLDTDWEITYRIIKIVHGANVSQPA